jgi:hypothetical protein
MKNILFAILLTAIPALAAGVPVTPATFAHRATITLGEAAPFHQLVLPLAVYHGLSRADVGDLRVFNGNGEMVPYALLRQQSATVKPAPEVAVPLFPIAANGSGDSGATMSVQVTRRGDDTLVAIAPPTAATAAVGAAPVRGLVIDVSRLSQNGARSTAMASPWRYTLRLQTGPTPAAAPFNRFTLSSSDDLQQWQTILSDGQLVHMEHDGQRIDRDSVTWDGAAGKYLRLVWDTPQLAPAVTAAMVSATDLAQQPAPVVWSGPLAPQRSAAGQYDYALPGRLPLELVQVGLPQLNTLAPITLQRHVDAVRRARRAGETDGYWQTLTSGVVFRLQSPGGDLTSPPLRLEQPAATRLRLLVDARGGGIGPQPPTLQVGFTPDVLLFLARGAGPFSLAWGAPQIEYAALAPATLMPGYRADQKLTAPLATLPAVVAPPSATPDNATEAAPVSKWILWGVLVAGVLVLGGMAALLLRQLKRPEGS